MKRETGNTLYILDEPTTGLHFEDIKVLLKVLNSLVDRGNSMIIIEHNLDIIKSADWIIDMGPEGGERGGTVIAQGKPEDIIKNKNSYTAKYLKEEL
jgi:excinuclease ABC subunit A